MNWKKIAARVGFSVALLIVLVAGLAYLVEHNVTLHRYVLAKAIGRAEQSTGLKIQIGAYSISWVPLKFELANIIIRGDEPQSARPLVSAPHASVSISWRALISRKLDLTDLTIDSPVVNLLVNAQGASNIPSRPTSGNSSTVQTIFNLAIRHVAILNGELIYNNSARKIDADLAGLRMNVAYDLLRARYDGTLAYSNAVIVFDGYGRVRHNLDVRFNASRSELNLEKVQIATALSHMTGSATLRDYSNPVIQGHYDAAVSSGDLRDSLRISTISQGRIQLAGDFNYRSDGAATIDRVALSGHFSSDLLTVPLSGVLFQLRAASGDYRLDNGHFISTNIQADTLGGRIYARFDAYRLATTPVFSVAASAQSLSIGEANYLSGANGTFVRGTITGRGDASWTEKAQNLRAHSDATVSGSLNSGAGRSAGSAGAWVPFTASLHVGYDAARSTLTIANSSLQTNRTHITASGSVSSDSSLTIQARTSDVHEIDVLALAARNAFQTGHNAQPAKLFEIYGAASLNARAQGRLRDATISGRLIADHLQVQQTHWVHVQTNFSANPSSLSLQDGYAQTAGNGRIDFSLESGLSRWRYTMDQPIALQVRASRAMISALKSAINLSAPIAGTLSGNISVRGTALNPDGSGSLQLTNAVLWGEPIRNLTAQFNGSNRNLQARFAATAAAGALSGNGQYNFSDGEYQFQLGRSTLHLDRLKIPSSRGYTVGGTVAIGMQGRGTLKAPQLQATLAGDGLSFRGQQLGSIDATLGIANERAEFSLSSNAIGGENRANGNVSLQPGYMAHATFEMTSLQFGPLLATYVPSFKGQIKGEAEMRGQLDGPLATPDRIRAAIEMPAFDIAYNDFALASASPIRLTYENGVVAITRAELKGSGTDFTVTGTLPLRGPREIDVSAMGQIDLKVLSVLGPNTESSGTVNLNVIARGVLRHPSVTGSVNIVNAAFASDAAPVGIENLNGKIDLSNGRATIESLAGQMSGGTVSASGFLSYEGEKAFSLRINGTSVRLRYPQGTRAVLDANLNLNGTPAASALNGSVTIDRLSFTPEFDLANFIGQFSSSAAPSTSSPWEQTMRLSVSVQSSQELALSSAKLSLEGSANLQLEGTAANPVILGRTTLTGGELFFIGNRYQIQNGTIIFANPVRTVPVINLYVTTVVEQYNLTLNFTGPFDRLQTHYTSDPALPPADIINLLAFGKTTAQSANNASTPASLGAESVIAQGVTSQLSSRLEKFAGISQLQIDPSLGGQNTNIGARIAVQQRLTKNVIFNFATDVTDTQNEVFQLKYQTQGRLSLSLTRDEYGSWSIEARIRKNF